MIKVVTWYKLVILPHDLCPSLMLELVILNRLIYDLWSSLGNKPGDTKPATHLWFVMLFMIEKRNKTQTLSPRFMNFIISALMLTWLWLSYYMVSWRPSVLGRIGSCMFCKYLIWTENEKALGNYTFFMFKEVPGWIRRWLHSLPWPWQWRRS